MAAEWTQLPKELLDVIAQRLGTPSDILRFRSVCSTWRSSVSPKPRRLPNLFRILPNDGISTNTWGFYLSKRTIFHLSFPENPRENFTTPLSDQPNSWLIKIEEDVPDRMHLMNPLSSFEFKPLPTSFPRTLDLLKFRVWELGQEYVLQYISFRPFANSLADAGTLYMEKVVFCCSDDTRIGGAEFVVLTIHVSGKLAILRSGDKKWTILEDMPSPYDDVILYKGKFYAVDNTGRTVVVELCLNVNLVANSVFGGDKKYLVESNGELWLVDMYLSIDTEEGLDNNGGDAEVFYQQFEGYISERVVRFKVFKLNVEDKKWVAVKNLGDRLLFLGENSTFSVSASDFAGSKENCIYFVDNLLCSNRTEDGPLKDCGIGVFDLENGRIAPLTDHPGCSKLFWPPPSWITSTMMEVENHFGDLSV